VRKVSARNVLQGAVESTGRLYSNLTNDEFVLFRGAMNRRLREAYELEFWPDLMTIEKRYWRDTWLPVYTYADGAEVYVSALDKYYTNSSGGDTTGTPGTSSDWTSLTSFINYVSHEQNPLLLGSNSTEEIGATYRGTSKDPRLSLDYETFPFEVKDIGVVFPYVDKSYIYLEYRKRAPEIKGDKFDSTKTYYPGQQVFYEGTDSRDVGEFYDVQLESTNSTTSAPSTNGTVHADWKKVDIPYIFGAYMEKAISADILLLDEKSDLAGIQFNESNRLLGCEVKKATNQQGDTVQPKFRGY
jgi:hypothetical protein